MIDRKTVCEAIGEAKEWHMTPETIHSFAALLYVKEHLPAAEACELTPEEAETWVAGMENADGTTGESFSRADTDEFREDCGSLEFWVTMNMMASDYSGVAKAFSIAQKPLFYANLAHAFLDDKDAAPGKLCSYYRYIAGGAT